MKIAIMDRNNEMMKSGNLDNQIIRDFEELITKLEDYQDAVCKKHSPHQDDWTNKNQAKITYAKRIVECVRGNQLN